VLAAAGADRALEVCPDVAARHAIEVVRPHRRIVVEALEPVAADDLMPLPAGELEEEVVREGEDALGIDPDCDQRDALERLAKPLFGIALGRFPSGPHRLLVQLEDTVTIRGVDPVAPEALSAKEADAG